MATKKAIQPCVLDPLHETYLKQIKFDLKWLDSLAKEYGFTRYEYLHKFRAFRCIKDDKHIEWFDINEFSLYNGGRKLDKIMTKYQPLNPKRQLIERYWRI